jgi:tetratricopeptide (TPR) repeat protein
MQYLVAFLLFLGGTAVSQRVDQSSAAAIVSRIQRADYEGDRAALKRLYEDLAPFTEDKAIGSRIHYWRGFALWRRAFNGFNESADRDELERDLTSALAEFKKAVEGPDPADAQAAAASCLQNLAFLHYMQKDAGPARDFLEQSLPLLEAAETAEPDNPRVLWVLGASRWYAAPERGGAQAAALATYERGLAAARQHRPSANEPLKPSWGEPELLMNLAWAKAHESTPDLKQAEQYANSALAMVPYWHYVPDILLPQIRAAMKDDKKEGR